MNLTCTLVHNGSLIFLQIFFTFFLYRFVSAIRTIAVHFDYFIYVFINIVDADFMVLESSANVEDSIIIPASAKTNCALWHICGHSFCPNCIKCHKIGQNEQKKAVQIGQNVKLVWANEDWVSWLSCPPTTRTTGPGEVFLTISLSIYS